MSKIISVDFETFYDTKNGYGIKEMGGYKYVNDPRFDPYLISVADEKEAWAGQPKDFNWNALDGATLVSHNKGFDSRVHARMVQLGLAPPLSIEAWYCTANMCTFLAMRRDLARAVEFLLGIKISKDVRGDADGKHWDDLVKADGGKSMLEYARGDAVYCRNLFMKFGHLWPESERRISDLTIRQCQRGCQIDTDKLVRYLRLTQEMLIQAELDLPWMKEGKKPTSPKAIAEECRKNQIPCPPVKAREGEEAFEQWERHYSPRFAWVKAYSDYRLLKKLLASLETIKERLSPEGIFGYELLYFGAHTGRWAGAGGFNVQNMRKEAYYRDVHGRLITDEKILDGIAEEFKKNKRFPEFVSDVIDIRSLFMARPGKKMIVSDLSQIEPRVLAWMVGDEKMLDMMRSGKSPYQAHGEATMGWNRGDIKELIESGDLQAKYLYALWKARVLGLGYGCGWEKFITVAQTMAGIDITEDDPEFEQAVDKDGTPCYRDGNPIMVSGYGSNSKRIVKEYREQNPLVVGIWKTLDEEFKNSVGRDFSITLPSGRTLRYPQVKLEAKMVPDPENPLRFKRKMVYTALAFDQKVNAVVRKIFYGGLLTENATQAIARDVFGGHLITLDETSGIDVLFTSHDEAITEVDNHITARDVSSIMSKAPEWMPGLPVSAEAKEVPHYKK